MAAGKQALLYSNTAGESINWYVFLQKEFNNIFQKQA